MNARTAPTKPVNRKTKTVYIFLTALFVFFCVFLHSGAGWCSKIVVDQLGRRITLPENPERVVSLAPSITEIIFALNQGHRLKGVTMYSDFPPEAKKLPRVGSYVHPDLERIVALQPDLCLATKDGNPREIVRRLESLGIPVYAVNPRDMEAILGTIREIGKLLNATGRAESLTKEMGTRIEKIKALVGKTDRRPRVFFQIGISPIVSIGTPTFTHELIELAGGINISEGPVAYPRYSREQLLALSPEVFIVSSMAGEKAIDRARREWQQLQNVPAVRDGRLFFVDSNLFDRPTPRMVEALELLVRLIHPELFKVER